MFVTNQFYFRLRGSCNSMFLSSLSMVIKHFRCSRFSVLCINLYFKTYLTTYDSNCRICMYLCRINIIIIMESKKSQAKRIIVKCIKESRIGQLFKDIVLVLEENEIYVSHRTTQRYISELTEMFIIEYSQENKRYVINALADQNEVEQFINLLELNNLSQLAITAATDIGRTSEYIISESINSFKGVGHLKIILEGLESNKSIRFEYKTKFQNKSSRHVKPILVKEYQNRWYLIAYDIDKKALRTFGLDRIYVLSLDLKSHHPLNTDEVFYIFENMIGVDSRLYNPNQPMRTKIEVRAYDTQPNYFKSLPLHKSQKIIEETSEYTLFQYEIFLNYEFKQHVLMYGSLIEIMKPEWLRDQFKKDVQGVLNKYD